MAAELELRSIAEGLESDKAAERRRCRELLRHRMPRGSALRPETYYRLFNALHHAIIKDLESNRVKVDVDALYSSMIIEIIIEANTQLRYVDIEVVLNSAFEILRYANFTRVIGNTYITILGKYVFRIPYYLQRITPLQWEETIEVVIKSIETRLIDDTEALRLLSSIIEEGFSRCHFVTSVRNNISAISNFFSFEELEQKENLQESLLNIAISIIENIGAESPTTICTFTGEVTPSVLKFYKRTTTVNKTNKKMLLFKFLRLCISIRHPKGRIGTDMNGDDAWNAVLQKIYHLILAEARFINENHKNRPASLLIAEFNTNNELVKLSVELFQQIFLSDVEINSNVFSLEPCTSYKRLKYDETYNVTSIQDVLNTLKHSFYPWILIMNLYISKYGHNIDDVQLYGILEEYHVQLKSDFPENEQNMLYEGFVEIIDVFSKRSWKNNYNELFLKIWNIITRKASVQCQTLDSCHRVVNSLLRLVNFHPNVNTFIQFYTDQTMPFSCESLKNLNILIDDRQFNVHCENTRKQILKWLLGNYSTAEFELLPFVMFKLCVKERVTKPERISTDKDVMFETVFEDQEAFLLMGDFELNLLIDSTDDAKKSLVKHPAYDVWTELYNVTVSTVSTNISNKILHYKGSQSFDMDIITDMKILLSFLSLFVEYEIFLFSNLENDLKAIMAALELLNSYLETSLKNTSEDSNKINILKKLKSLFDVRSCNDDVNMFIRNRIRKEIIQAICYSFSNDSEEVDGGLFEIEENSSSVSSNLQCKTLALDNILHLNAVKSRFTDKMMNYTLQIDNFDLKDGYQLDMAMDMLNFIMNSFKEDNIPIDLIVKFMQNMCKIVYRDNDATYKLLRILFKVLSQIGKTDLIESKENCLIMLQSFFKQCTQSYYAPKTMGQALKCLKCVLIDCDVNNQCGISNDLLFKGLRSDVHSIRIYSAYCICAYVSKTSLRNFSELYKILVDLFNIDTTYNASESVISDEGAVRVNVVLLLLASLSVLNSAWHKKYLSLMIQLANEKNIKDVLIKKTFHLITASMNITYDALISNNIPFLIKFCFEKKIAVQQFPHNLTQHDSLDSFILGYKDHIIPLEMFYLPKAPKYAIESLKLNTSDLITQYFSDLLVLHFTNSSESILVGNIESLKSALEARFDHKFPGTDTIKTLITGNLHKMLFKMVLCVHDEELIFNVFKLRCTTYATNSTSYKKLLKIIAYLNDISGVNIIKYICDRNAIGLNEISVKLWFEIDAQYTAEQKLISLQHFWIYCDLLPLDSNLNTYLVHFVINSLLSLIRMFADDSKFKIVSSSSCKILHMYLLKILPRLNATVSSLLSTITSTLLEFIQKRQDDHFDDAVNVLKMLQTNMKEKFSDIIVSIDPLTDSDNLKHVNAEIFKFNTDYLSLSQYIQHFIKNNSINRYQGLDMLYSKLKSNQRELFRMYDELKNQRGFSEDCHSSALHQLSYILLDIISNTDTENVRIQACRCLGVLGPSTLHTLILKLPPDYSKIIDKPLECFLTIFIREIMPFMFDKDPRVMKAISKALQSVLNSTEGRLIAEKTMKEFVAPFSSGIKTRITTLKINAATFDNLNKSDLWCKCYQNHSDWLLNIIKSALACFSDEQSFFSNLIGIFELKISVSEKCFAPLIGLILSVGNEQQVTALSGHFKEFFEHYDAVCLPPACDELFIDDMRINFNKASVDCMLQLLEFIRMQSLTYQWKWRRGVSIIDNPFELDYIAIAQAAYLNDSYFIAIFYCELWYMSIMDVHPSKSSQSLANFPRGEEMLKILRLCYKAIGDDDALTGCGSSHFLNLSERRTHFLGAKSYIDAFLLHDVSLSNSNPENLALYASSLLNSSLYRLSARYIDNLNDNSCDDIKYECFWRLGDWSLDSNRVKGDSSESWNLHQYTCLKKTLTRETLTAESPPIYFRDAFDCISKNYSGNGIEDCESVYKLALKCQILREIEEVSKLTETFNDCEELIDSWSVENILPFANFQNIEPILSQRIVILDQIMKNNFDVDLKSSIVRLRLKYADLAEFHGWSNTSNRWINETSQIVGTMMTASESFGSEEIEKLQLLVMLAEGSATWKSGHQDIAKHLVRSVICKTNNSNDELYAKALMTYGAWMVDARQESPSDILNNYLQSALNVLGDRGNLNDKLETYLVIARFADAEYKQIDSYMKSANYVNQIKRMKRCQNTLTSLKEKAPDQLSKDQIKARTFNNKQVQLDTIEIRNMDTERMQYLQLAIKYYLLTLLHGEKNNHCVFRMISLWLDNPIDEINANSETSPVKLFESIPTWKFLSLLPQLGPRLKTFQSDLFQKNLHNLIEKCAVEHPYHTLPIIFALKNSFKDFNDDQAVKEEGYTIVAQQMLKKLIVNNKNNISNIIKEMDVFSTAMIKLANLSSGDTKVSKRRIPKSESLNALQGLQHVLIPTIVLPINHNLRYENIPYVLSYSDEFSLVGGVNCPKKISCRGSDGIEHNMLIKCDSDIRQDAVMQQVFEVVNELLRKHHQTNQNRLIIRTYKLVVLSRRSAVLKWCDGTESFGFILTGSDGSKGLHGRFHPKDIPALKARKAMIDKFKSSNDEKLHIFKTILDKFKPVFQYFFIENFQSPPVWYEKKLAYTRSVATSSMIGYILGIGDRHVQNILIDKLTAEVIHIDFGITFEQGRLQPTPETVPFRLTQNMVAGFGCAGVEGIFKQSCIKTMDVLKANEETLLTILEVLLCDPLYIWTCAGPKSSKDDESDSEASRVLTRVQSKLKGSEFGRMLATSGQIARLIQEATDITNLSRLFHGWQPYL